MTRPIVFSDLDDTVFQTARKMAAAPDPALLASEALNGSHSYMTPAQAVMVDWLIGTTQFIPVTARSTEALARCTLPFSDYRVCSNGAVILMPDGTADAAWLAQTRAQAQAAAGLLEALGAYIAEWTAEGRFRCWTVEEFGTGFYFCVKSNAGAEALDEVEEGLAAIAGDALVRHRNDNNLSYTPAGISKQRAVEYLHDKLARGGEVPVFGMGDSLTDLPFMALCDMLVVPRRSQIMRDVVQG